MALDEGSRARLRTLAEAGDVELDEHARARIARRVAAEGPGIVRRAQRVRVGAQAASAGLALGLCCVGLWLAQRGAPRDQAVSAPPARVAPQPAETVASSGIVTPRACQQRAPISALPSATADGGQRFDLGEIGVVVAAQDTVVALEVADPCRVRVRLERGSVAVHAADLGGGELRVATRSAEVSVHGTVFSVTERAGELIVDVDEGRVSVAQPGRATPWALVAGVRLRVPSAGDAATTPLAAADRAALQRAVGLAPAPAPPAKRRGEPAADVSGIAPAPSAEALLAEADELWRTGALDRARDRYRRAGALDGVTAEAAWLALARRELSVSRPAAARAALARHRARFPRGKLAGEALGIDFRAAVQQADHAAAGRIARELQARYPGTPQAEAAARWAQQQHAAGGE